LDATDTFSWNDGDLDVSIFAPACSPGVLDEPVFLSVFSSVADCENGVVECGSAIGVVKDTCFVELEDSFVSLN